MPSTPPPCCPEGQAAHRRELAHVYHFDFDLHQCTSCLTFWVVAWSEGRGGFEPVTEADAATMLTLDESEMRPFMRRWAESFN